MSLDRYTLPAMQTLMSDHYKLHLWCEVEVAAAEAQGAPDQALRALKGNSQAQWPDAKSVEAAELRTGHDVMAFLQVWNQRLPAYAKPWLHRGMTSSDLVDTANSLLMKRAGALLVDESFRLFETAVMTAVTYAGTVRVGRTHGQHAEITTWGHWLAGFANAAYRAHKRLEMHTRAASLAKLSGAVGDYKSTHPDTEGKFAQLLQLGRARAATQVIHRDSYADLVWSCAQAATVVESLAVEIRLGQQTELAELREPRPGSSPTGSSAMPHKVNPITSEQLTGLARLVRAQVQPVQEGMVLWHERDISHSSVERVALRQALSLTHYMLVRARQLLSGLEVDEERMEANVLDGTNGRILSSTARGWLVANGLTDPQLAWQLVAKASMLQDDPMPEAVIKVANSWIRENRVPASQFPDFAPDWVKFREAMDIDRQVSVHAQYSIRQLQMLYKVVADNRLKQQADKEDSQ